jgi:hypothetical protein
LIARNLVAWLRSLSDWNHEETDSDFDVASCAGSVASDSTWSSDDFLSELGSDDGDDVDVGNLGDCGDHDNDGNIDDRVVFNVDTTCVNKEMKAHLAFTAAACKEPAPCDVDVTSIDSDVMDNLRWIADNSVTDIKAFRDAAMLKIEQADARLRESGAAQKWLAAGDPCAQKVSGQVNGPLLEELARITGYWDPSCVDTLRHGGNVAGRLPNSGCGTAHEFPEASSTDDLYYSCAQRNRETLQGLREDPEAQFLLDEARKDAALGRMTEPVDVSQVDASSCLFARRFSREQGIKADGRKKLRAVDDETGAGTNNTCQPTEKLHNDQIDALVATIVQYCNIAGEAPGLWKADIDAAYRRIPVRSDQRWLVWVVMQVCGKTYASRHNCMPFGCVGSVHAWNRVGALLCHIGRHVLRLPLLRYVDDFFALDKKGCEVHAMECFARLVRVLLGSDAIADRKLEAGMPLVVLGLSIAATKDDVSVSVSAEKAEKWSAKINEALTTGTLNAGDASKMAGQLQFAAQHTFMRLGRAMVRPLYAQQYKPLPRGRVGPMLRLALTWWSHVFKEGLLTSASIRQQRPVVDLFCDARGSPARVAAVLVKGHKVSYTDWAPPADLLRTFQAREDNQIMGQELLAIVVGLSTFAAELRGCAVRVWTDNAGGEGALRKGGSKASDHNLLIHATWLLAARGGFGMYIYRVPTKDNIADSPSREEYTLLEAMGADWRRPWLPNAFWQPASWEAVAV